MRDYDIAKTNLPEIMFCENEPFMPDKIGYQIHRTTSLSNTFATKKNIVIGDDVSLCIEYQIYWHYDITHMFDLEHIWVYLNEKGSIVNAECSFHGRCINALLNNGENIVDNKLVLYSQPGKHAFASSLYLFEVFPEFKDVTFACAGEDGLATIFYDDGKYKQCPYIDRLVTEHMKQFAFVPSQNYVKHCLDEFELLPWEDLKKSFVPMVDSLLDSLILDKKHIVVFMDSGDTIIDEGTQLWSDEEDELVLRADVIPGADEAVKTLYSQGYTLILVADGRAQSFLNVLNQNEVYDCFESLIYSECIKASKPDKRMFRAAMGAGNLTDDDIARIAMVGNNLERDIRGANALGITSILLSWSPRYPMTPTERENTPNHTIKEPSELVGLINKLNERFIESLINTH